MLLPPSLLAAGVGGGWSPRKLADDVEVLFRFGTVLAPVGSWPRRAACRTDNLTV